MIRDILPRVPAGTVLGITAELTEKARKDAAQAMRNGALRIVVATSTWSTGLDIPALRYVFITGRGKAPIGALQSVGRAMRVADGKLNYEIINLVDVGAEPAAQRREDILLEEGFVKDLESEPAIAVEPPQPQGSGWILLLGPAWVWKVFAVYAAIRLSLQLLTGN